jgi:hypothetical protein
VNVLDRKSLARDGIRIPQHTARSLVTIPTELCRLLESDMDSYILRETSGELL